MNPVKIIFAFLLLLASVNNYAQLGFCSGSKGDPVFTENFGNGSGATSLPPGTTTYPFSPTPNDGFYSVINHSNFFQPSWHVIPDHTPDATNGPSGKMMIVNANTSAAGDFFKKTVTGLCVNTTFEFSAWLINLYNSGSNICVGAAQIPINVRFEIWNVTETVLLASGDTGNIFGTPAPLWQQFALVFTTVSDTSVVLKMKNNGVGGCGNDLAIDDISFAACGNPTTVDTFPTPTPGNIYTSCNPLSLHLKADSGATPYFYQWQSSPDGTNWTDLPGQTNPDYYTLAGLNTLTYFRVKAAQDAANLSNPFCSINSNVFTISPLAAPGPASNDGDRVICSGDAIPALSVTPPAGASVNWYSTASGGTLLLANSATYIPTAAGIYHAETYNPTTNCIGSRIPVSLNVIALPDVTITAPASICSGTTAVISFVGTPNATVTYTVNSSPNQTIILNASGSASISIPLTSTTIYTLVNVVSGGLNPCTRIKNDSVTITVNGSATASISTATPSVCSGTSATVNFNGTPNAIVTYKLNSNPNQTIPLSAGGNASIVIPSVTTTMNYTLIDVNLGGTCGQALSQSISISAAPLPIASISANPLTICSGQTGTFTFSGTPNTVVTYTVNSSPNQTIVLGASGVASVSAPLTTNTTYTLVSVATAGTNPCITIINAPPVTIAVNNSPTASVSSNTNSVCNGAPATVSFSGTPNATVTYTVNAGASQTVVLNAAGNASILLASVTATTNYTLVDVTSPGPNGCTQTLIQSVTITAVPLPTATVTANPAAVCSGQSSTVTFSGTPNAVVTYKVNGGANQTITLSAAGSAFVNITPSVNTTYQLVGAALGTGCSQSLTGSAAISINLLPNLTYTGDLSYCEGEAIAIVLSSAVSGTTFSWTVNQNGTTGAIAGTGNQIKQTLALLNDTVGIVTYTVTPFYNGCAGNPVAITVNIYPLPVPGITDGTICLTSAAPPSSQFYTLDTNLNAADHTFQWFFGGTPIPGASGSTYNANQIGTYTVIATNTAGCISAPVSAVVGEMSQGESLIVQQSEAFSDNPMISVAVVGGDGPFSYQLDNAPFQSSNVFHDVSAGTHTITVIDAYCTYLTTSVTILDYPKYFTPNGDGYHDTWNVNGIDGAVIRIFDRYGKLLKQISPDGLGWDGIYNNRLLPSTDYWFTIDYSENGANKTFRAHFALKR